MGTERKTDQLAFQRLKREEIESKNLLGGAGSHTYKYAGALLSVPYPCTITLAPGKQKKKKNLDLFSLLISY